MGSIPVDFALGKVMIIPKYDPKIFFVHLLCDVLPTFL
jgi:hypothetical protein